MFHLVISLYLAEICLVGLFFLHSAWVLVALMVAFVDFTAIVHFTLNHDLTLGVSQDSSSRHNSHS